MGCNCGGGAFQIDDGLEPMRAAPSDPSYFWNGSEGITSANAEGALVAPDGVPIWNPDTGRTESAD